MGAVGGLGYTGREATGAYTAGCRSQCQTEGPMMGGAEGCTGRGWRESASAPAGS